MTLARISLEGVFPMKRKALKKKESEVLSMNLTVEIMVENLKQIVWTMIHFAGIWTLN